MLNQEFMNDWQPEAGQPSPLLPTKIPANSKRILAIDDNDDILDIIAFAFNHEGFQCEAIHDQAEMAASLAHRLPDLIVLDIMLPGANGYQLIEQLHGDTRTCAIPVIVITAKTEPMYRRISANLGVARHLTKPFQPGDLIAHARAILETLPQTLP